MLLLSVMFEFYILKLKCRMEIPPGHKVIQEGRARILYPADEDGDVPVSIF